MSTIRQLKFRVGLVLKEFWWGPPSLLIWGVTASLTTVGTYRRDFWLVALGGMFLLAYAGLSVKMYFENKILNLYSMLSKETDDGPVSEYFRESLSQELSRLLDGPRPLLITRRFLARKFI